VAQAFELPIQPVAGRSGFIGERQRGVLLCQPARQLRGRGRGVVDLAEVADLAVRSRPASAIATAFRSFDVSNAT